MDPLGTPWLIFSLLLIIILKVAKFVLGYLQKKSFHKTWEQGEVKKMRRVKGDHYRWKDKRIKDIKVGDIVKLEKGDISPFDLLILDTSEQRYSDNILKTNERKIRGESRIRIKRAIRNFDLKLPNPEHKGSSYLKKLAEKLNGYVEYDVDLYKNNWLVGSFKLNFDPKVTEVTEENILFCGSKLYSEVIGMVLFTGIDTRAMRLNYDIHFNVSILLDKRTFLFTFTSKVISILIGSAVVISFALTAILINNKDLVEQLRLSEGYLIGFNLFKKFLAILAFELNLISPALLFVYDMYIIYIAVMTKINGVPELANYSKSFKPKIEEATQPGVLPGKRHLRRKKTNTARRTQYNLTRTPSSPEHQPSIGCSYSSYLDGDELKSQTSGRKGKRRVTKGPGFTSHAAKESNIKTELDEATHIRIVNCGVLPDLGTIDNVFFDKTDTLTLGKMRVSEITTYARCYEVPSRNYLSLMDQYKRNPDDLAYEDDNSKVKETEDYSEKSQEYESELAGMFNHLVIDEDSDISNLFNVNMSPNYGHLKIESSNIEYANYSMGKNSPTLNRVSQAGSRHMQHTLAHIRGDRNPTKETSKEIKQLNSLEKRFRKTNNMLRMGERDSRAKSRYTVKGLENLSEDSQSSGMDEEEQEYKIDFKPDNKLTDKNFIYDVCSKKDHLTELLSLMMVCIQCNTSDINSYKSMNLEDRAISDLLQGLTFTVKHREKITAEDIDPNIMSLKNYTKYQIVNNNLNFSVDYDIICINAYTKKRGRMSIIIRDKTNNGELFLIVKGDESRFANNMSPAQMTNKEVNLLKSLTSDYKLQGLKCAVLAFKKLETTDVEKYLATYNTIRESTREQLDEFEKHASMLENNLYFLGCLGTKDIVRDDAHTLIASLEKAKVQCNILSGDSLDNCLIVAKELGLTASNLSDTSSFFHVNFKNHKQAIMDMRRFLDSIHEMLLDDHLEKMDKVLDIDKTDTKPKRPTLTKAASVDISLKEIQEEQQVEKQIQKKTLVISGDSVRFILSDPYIRDSMKTLLLFSDCVIGYSMLPFHKSTIVKLFSALGKKNLAIGDGLNDLAMFLSADVSIQLVHKDVRSAIADIVVHDMIAMQYLITVIGPKINKNLTISSMLIVWYTVVWKVLVTIHLGVTSFSESWISTQQLIFSHLIFFSGIGFFLIFNQPYTTEFKMEFPAVYYDRLLIMNFLSRAYILILAYALIEGFAIYITTDVVLSWITRSDGHHYTSRDIGTWAILVITTCSIFKVYFAFSRASYFHYIGLTGFLLIMCILYAIDFWTMMNDPLGYTSITDYFSNPIMIYTFTQTVVSILAFQWIVINYFKNRLIASVTFNLSQMRRRALKMTNIPVGKLKYTEFTNNPDDYVYQIIDNQLSMVVENNPITDIKECYTKSTIRDPSVQKILSIDYFNFSLPIDRFNRIKDVAERRKFRRVKAADETFFMRVYFSISCVLVFIEYMMCVLLVDYRNSMLLDSIIPYSFLICSLLLGLSFFKIKHKLYSKILDLSNVLFLFLNVVFTLSISRLSWKTPVYAYSRLILAPISNNSNFNIVVGFLNQLLIAIM